MQRGLHGVVVSLALALFAGGAWAQTPAGGTIASDTVWRASQSPILVGSDIQVQGGVTLTIEAGTTVYMAAATRFIVSGSLKANGTVQAPVVFTSEKIHNNQAGAAGDWQQIIFNAGSSASVLQYVQIAYGKGVMVNSAAPSFNYVTIKDSQGAAMAIDLASSPLGVGNKALNNSINAIVVPEGDIGANVTWGLRGIPYLVLAGKVSVGASPRIISMTPNSVQQGENQSVTVAGSRLTGLANIRFSLGGVSAQVLSATDGQAQLQLSAANEAALGISSLSALTNAGEVSFSNALTVVASQPKLSSVEPAAIYAHQGNLGVALKGENLAANSVAYLDTTALQTTFVSATELTAIVENQITVGSKTVTLRTPKPNAPGEYFTSNGVALSVIVAAPVATGIAPNALRRGEVKRMQISGTNLAGTELSTSASGLSISNAVLTPTAASFDLTASAGASLGVQQLRVTNSAGTSTVNVTINGALPVASIAPTPLAVPPDGSSRQFAIRLSFASTEDHTFAVSTGAPALATTSATSLTLLAGQTQVVGSVTGLAAGTTSLNLSSATMGNLSIPLFVTADFLGLNTTTTPMIGVVLAGEPVIPDPVVVPAISPSVGVIFGEAITGIAPRSVVVGTGPTSLVVSGSGLENAASVSLLPPDGITVGALSAAPDGRTLIIPVTVAADAPTTRRQVVVTSSSAKQFVASTPDADRLLVTLPVPEVLSVSPLLVSAATGGTTLTIRGKRLHSTQSIALIPAGGISLGSSYTINGDGTELSLAMAVASNVAPGERVIQVTTPAGSSDPVANSGNKLTVVNQLAGDVTPLAAPVVGIVLADGNPVPLPQYGLHMKPVNLVFGAGATGMSPRAKIVGDVFTLTVNGSGLQDVTSVSFSPATGLTLGAPVAAPDGRTVTVQVTIAEDAPKTARTLVLASGVVPVQFAQQAAAVFNVTGVVPSIDSVSPMHIQTGAPAVPMTIRGQNFRDLQSVSFVPAEGMTAFVASVVDADATELALNVMASSNAPLGQRAVVVTTLAGSTSTSLSIANTVTVAASAATDIAARAPLVGVVLQDNVTLPPVTISGLPAPHVGVVLADATPVDSVNIPVYAAPVGVNLGATAAAIVPRVWTFGTAGTLTIHGNALEAVTSVSLAPSQGVTIGALQVSPDGLQVSAPFEVAGDAAPTLRSVSLGSGAGPVAFSNPAAGTLGIYSRTEPSFSSMNPILAQPGTLLTLTIVGQNLQKATAITASPAGGLLFDTLLNINPAGTEATVRMQVAPNAAPGKRVIQLITPSGASSAVAGPANSFTVYLP